MENCSCGTNKSYANCCGAFISGQKLPQTPEALMRSRYTAYTKANIEYIIRTMKAPANNNFHPEEAREWAQQVDWLGLEIIKTTSNGLTGFVEFRAYFKHGNKNQVLHEISEFRQDEEQWYYINGTGPSH